MEDKSDEEQLAALIAEVQRNDYAEDLVTREGDSLLTVVDRKLEHPKCPHGRWTADDGRVKYGNKNAGDLKFNRAMMLALVMYTGCDSNYEMCKAERSGNYEKWEW